MPTIPRGVWLAYVMAAGLGGLQALLGVAGAPAAPPGAATPALAIDFGGTGAIEMTRVDDNGAYATVLVRNDSKADGSGILQVTAIDRDGGVVASTTRGITLTAGTVTPVP